MKSHTSHLKPYLRRGFGRQAHTSAVRQRGFTPTPISSRKNKTKKPYASMFAGKSNQQTQKEIGVSPVHTGRGFTLIESLISISVLLVAVSGPLTVAARGLISANISRDQVTAYFLALEGLELVRSQRDQNVLEGNDWLTDMDACLGSGTCQTQTSSTDLTFSLCPSGQCDLLTRTPEGIYGYYGGAEQTTFVRSIQIREITNDVEAEVAATISWSTGPLERTIELRTHLLRWLQ